MSEHLKPETPDQVQEAVRWALAEGRSFEVFGRRTRRGYGRPGTATDRLDLSALSGIELYEPDELVMSARAATALGEVVTTLAERRQRLAFEAPDWGPLVGGEDNSSGTIGGLFACNLAGPRRIQAGAARDHILGFHAINGRGEHFKSGGRVVKNVTGFDLSKLMAGSFGTLAVMTDLTFKVLPLPEKARTVLVLGDDTDAAIAALTTALQSPFDISGAAHLPGDIAAASAVSYVSGAGGGVTAIRVEGPGPSVEFRCRSLREMLAEFGETEELHSANTRALWREIRDVSYFTGGDDQVWRLSVPPSRGPGVARRLIESAGGRVFFDWGGGLIWLAMAARPDAAHDLVRAAIGAGGGHATLIRAAADVRAAVPVFQPQPGPLSELAARVKSSFDPRAVLNPGRMIEGL